MPPKRDGYIWHRTKTRVGGYWQKARIKKGEFVFEMPPMLLITDPLDNVCSHFGCGRTLTIREALFGTRCIHHQLITPIVYRYKNK